MTNRERLNATLSFEKPAERGSVMETFFPWDLTVKRWQDEGLDNEFVPTHFSLGGAGSVAERYLNAEMAVGVRKFESFFGHDALIRFFMNPPFFDLSSVEEPAVKTPEDWYALKEKCREIAEQYYTDENIEKIYGQYAAEVESGEATVRLAIWGFFWSGFMLIGMENHLFSFYDMPEVLHDIAEFLTELYLKCLDKLLRIIPVDTVYIMEDLSGKNGPMLSPEHFDEFVGAYYKRLVPMLKELGVKHVIVDTDGDFGALIPNFIDAGIEGFLPMDVNAGMDIVAVRKQYPTLKFIGGYNKLEIAKGKEAIDAEFERILPVVRQGGYVPGSDHQVAPNTPLADYLYYVERLKEVMKQSGADL